MKSKTHKYTVTFTAKFELIVEAKDKEEAHEIAHEELDFDDDLILESLDSDIEMLPDEEPPDKE